MTVLGRPGSLLFPSFAAAVIALKLALTAHIGIRPIDGPYDETNYILHALTVLSGSWFGPYNELTLIKMPFFPLFLAAISKLGIALPIAHQVLYCGATLVACVAVRPLLAGARSSCALLAFLLFEPSTFGNIAWLAMRSQIVGSLALLAVSCACAMFVRRNGSLGTLLPWSLGLTLSFSAFWLTREESVWLLPCVAVLLGLYVAAQRRLPLRDAAPRVAFALIPPIVAIVLYATIVIVNQAVYGWGVIVETESPEFLAAFDSLARIEHHRPNRLVPVPRESLQIAYRISPAARELRAGFESGASATARSVSCLYVSVCDDIAGGWFIYVLRDAAATGADLHSAGAARDYYVRLSREIDAACEAGTVACRAKPHGIVATFGPSDVPSILRTYAHGLLGFFTFSKNPRLGEIPAQSPDTIALYRKIVGFVAIASPAGSPAGAALAAIAAMYRAMLVWLSLLTGGCIIVAAVAASRSRFRLGLRDDITIGASIFLSVFALVAILALVQTYLFSAFYVEYFSAGYPVTLLAIGLILSSESAKLVARLRAA